MTRSNPPGAASLEALFAPRSVAILGASDDPKRIGGRPLAYLLEAGFKGTIYPVNPSRDRVQGLPAYASVTDLPEVPDAAILALPAAKVEEAVTALAGRGVKACILFASGFAETGDTALQARVAAIARAGGMRLVGPNCLGAFSVPGQFYASFSTVLDRGLPVEGRLSIVSQSGAFGSHLYYLARQRGIGVRHWVTTGNEADVTVAECIEHFAHDPGTQVIMAYAEGFTDGDRLVSALTAARAARKPVVFMKVGRSEIGAEAAQSHTAALAGADTVCDAVLRQFGAFRARSTEELVDVAHIACAGALPAGPKLGIVTISGGVGVLMTDAASDHGLDVAPMPEAAQAALKARLPFAGVRNPIDFTAQAFNDPALVGDSLNMVLEQGGYDAVAAFLTSVPGSAANAGPIRAALEGVRRAWPDFPLVLSMLVDDPLRLDYEAMGYPVFPDPSNAVAALAGAGAIRAGFDRTAPPDLPSAAPPLPDGPLDEHAAKQVLAAAGIPVLAEHLATSAEDAVAAWRAIGRPVAVKLVSPDIQHKSEVGGVVLGLNDEGGIRAAFDAILSRAGAHDPQARLTGVLVAPMEGGADCVEVLLGVQRDPVFGPVVVLGLGGVLVELLGDVTFRRAPIDDAEARAMIGELRGAALLDGLRGRPAVDKDALVKALVALSQLAAMWGDEIESIDINPFLLRPQGQGAVALDALIVRRDKGSVGTREPHERQDDHSQ